MRSSNENVQRKRSVDGHADLDRLIELIAARHDDENIDVAVRVRPAVGMRTKQDDFLGIKPLRQLTGEAADGRLRNIRSGVPLAGARCSLRYRRMATTSFHIPILPQRHTATRLRRHRPEVDGKPRACSHRAATGGSHRGHPTSVSVAALPRGGKVNWSSGLRRRVGGWRWMGVPDLRSLASKCALTPIARPRLLPIALRFPAFPAHEI